jgi:hypothetical protein
MTRGRAIDTPTVIPCRDPTSGIRHPFDLVTLRRCSSGALTERFKDFDLSNKNRAIEPMSRPLNGVVGKLDTGSLGRGPTTGLRPGTSE